MQVHRISFTSTLKFNTLVIVSLVEALVRLSRALDLHGAVRDPVSRQNLTIHKFLTRLNSPRGETPFRALQALSFSRLLLSQKKCQDKFLRISFLPATLFPFHVEILTTRPSNVLA